jgi:tetratricopeptide (TPR) repeat protein
MELKSKLIELIEHTSQEEQALFARLSEDERAVRGEPDRWSPKDTIAHLAAWKTRLAEDLAAAARGETPVRDEDFEVVNARVFELNRDRSWSEILEEAAKASQQLVEHVERTSEAELRGTETLPWQGDRPLWRVMVGTGTIHPLAMHLGPLLIERGEKEYATQLQEEAAKLLSELDESQSWQGTVQYNLTCHYALAGETETAIGKLREALELNPELTEWSKEDADLASLREEPGYKALYTS